LIIPRGSKHANPIGSLHNHYFEYWSSAETIYLIINSESLLVELCFDIFY